MEEIIKTGNQGFLSNLREALSGSERDFTSGSLRQAIFLLSVPMVLEMFMESVFAIVDIYFVGKLGANAVAVVGLTESLLALIYAVAVGLSIGATATVARRIGEKDNAGAAKSAVHVILLGIIVSIVLGIVGIIFAADFLRLLGAEEAVVAEGTNFVRIMLGGNCVIVFLFLLNAIFRGAGDAAIAMRVLTFANILNIIFAPIFIFGFWIIPAFGVTGAAIATVLGRGIGVLYAAFRLWRGDKRLIITRESLTIDFSLLWQLIKLSSSAVLQYTISTASWIGLVRIVSSFGSEALAGYTIGLRVIIFALLPSLGMSNAAATLVGQNLGAGKPERAEQAVWLTGIYNALFLTSVGVLFFIFATPIIALFTDDAAVLNYGVNCLRIVSCGFLFYGFGMVFEQSFNGAGDTFTPTMINLFVFWLFEIPLAYVLANYFGFGTNGVFLAITIAFSTLAIVSGFFFKRGKWKLRKV